MCRNTHHANRARHPPLQVIFVLTAAPGELHSLNQGGLFLTVAEDTNDSTTTGGRCNCPGNRKRKSLVASLTELLSRPWAVRECRVVTNEWDLFNIMTPGVQLNLPHPTVCQHGNAAPFTTTSRRYSREGEVVELEGNHTYERN
ncbi:hypothetical protein F5Y00DRAFT_260229 [Daldinia vernicosa]|uniref:uncharacterized protein n=1 Tax=Daldinia vernicosa TaxID=114800 RepID=UPI0020083361|nr:uncharacterized protein F5Y00DRAFT_260229 [Daldinia vernicosa]KAI0850779.1 hypothetical protein F5Y00DRAFT_260229 [Daldinia vernicosa]